MNTNNWAACPRCKDGKNQAVIDLEKDMEEAYGKVALHVHRSMEQRLLLARSEAEKANGEYGRDCSFREDWEIYGADTGTVKVSYSGQCTVCSLSLSFEQEYPFYPAPVIQPEGPLMDQRIAIGGLMRCCLETVRLYVQGGGFPAVGERLSCKYCSDYIIATHDGDPVSPIIWRWPGTADERNA